MIALMSPQSPLLDSRLSSSTASMTMSLTLLPSSPVTYTQPSLPSRLPHPRKPKLSLNTTQLPTAFGKSSTSLRLETLSATSPTARNTFSNAYDSSPTVPHPRARSQRLPPLNISTSITSTAPRTSTSLRDEVAETPLSSSNESATTTSSLSSVESLTSIPYKLPYNARPILINGPIKRTSRPRRRSLTISRPMFAVAKKVSFKEQLTEEITTVKYTMAHSDLASSSSTISSLSLSTTASELHTEPVVKTSTPSTHTTPPQHDPDTETAAASPRAGEKRDSSDEDSDTCPETPVAGRRKKRREWVWTLAPAERPKLWLAGEAEGGGKAEG
ncbi:hypothetical protein LTR66_002665 [Elasticomyces elasticus]|nr:hypothetical protein LTR50_004454 [Elasticomyces elasticus]KAK4998055.1 hypothetical protein LTR66_002665 [Elasticomyces elasticus]